MESLVDVLQQPVRISEGREGDGGWSEGKAGEGGKRRWERREERGGKRAGGKGLLLNGGFQATEAHATAGQHLGLFLWWGVPSEGCAVIYLLCNCECAMHAAGPTRAGCF